MCSVFDDVNDESKHIISVVYCVVDRSPLSWSH